MRCFLALDIPSPVRNYLARVARESLTKGELRWVGPEQMHVTLVFAGEIPTATATALRDAMLDVDAWPMSFSLADLGHFPPRGEPRVVWAGLSGDVDELRRVQGQLAARAEDLGIEREKRPFSPHITLGRVKTSFGAYAIVDQLKEVGEALRDKPFEATAMTLYESELTPRGAVYRTVARRDLTA